VRDQPNARLLERLLFLLATLLIGVGSWLRTWALSETATGVSGTQARSRGFHRLLTFSKHLGNLLFSIGLASLAPLWGFILLTVGEAVVVLRLIGREEETGAAEGEHPAADGQPIPRRVNRTGSAWAKAIRRESGKWGLFLTTIVFSLLLHDRLAEILAGLSFAAWIVLNCGSLRLPTMRS
jgi:hypothetical protein